MKILIIYFTLFFWTSWCFGQDNDPRLSRQLSLNFLVPSIEYEMPLEENLSIDVQLGTAIGYAKSDSSSEFGVFPVFQTQLRRYYNLEKRLKKGKKISNNSGNYFAALLEVRSGHSLIGELDLNEDYAAFAGPVWGLQRIYNSGFKLNLNIGAGYGLNNLGQSYFSPIIGIQLGWLLKG